LFGAFICLRLLTVTAVAAQVEDGQDSATATSTPVAGRSPWLLASGGAAAEPANISTLLFWESSTNTTSTYSYNTMRVDARWTNVTPAGETIIVTNSPPAMRLLF
jgi:hypothetical protein